MGVVELEGLRSIWRWVGLTACMAIARVSGEAQAFEAECGGGGGGVESVAAVCSLCVVLVVGVSTGFWWKVARRKTEILVMRSLVGSLKQYRLKEIEDITGRFKLELGRGGQGVVYFAVLPEGRGTAAVKRMKKKGGFEQRKLVGGCEKESQEKDFWAEVRTISPLHHRNLVALLGYCVEEDDLFLVYEFMAKGSLSQHLHSRTSQEGGGLVLDWAARMRCAIEVARGLEYLHSHANPSLVHRDIKSGNILFDEQMNAKISDFGLSKPVISGEEPTVSKRVSGTHGYVDPVYLRNGQPCDKNDVYSYGVVLLELITGRRAIQQNLSLVEWCKDFLHTEEHVMPHVLPSVVDSRMNRQEVNWDQLFEVVKIARNCVQEIQEDRPSMQDVSAALYYANCRTSGGPFDNTTLLGNCSPSYDIKENSIRVVCIVANSRIVLRCKIWPTLRNFGLNKVEASMNGAIMWKKNLWWYNAKSSHEFTVGDNVKVTAEWHVTLRTNWNALGPNDPRRNQGPFCIEYLALKDERGEALVDYKGDKSPLLEST